jgi:hypothetical protein
MVFSFGGFCTGVSAAIVVKLTCSLDNLLWLSAFLTPKLSRKQRTQNALTYALICVLQTCLAYFISTFGEEMMESLLGKNGDHMSADRILTLISASALLVYSIFLGKEYYDKNYGGEDEDEYTLVRDTFHGSDFSAGNSDQRGKEAEEDENGVRPNPQDVEVGNMVLPLEIEDGTDSDSSDRSSDRDMNEQVEDGSPRSNKGLRSLAVISFLGALDDLALLVSMLVGKSFGIVELMIGTIISALAIVLICLFLTKCKLVADILEKIPLVAIVTGFCVVLLAKGIFFMD